MGDTGGIARNTRSKHSDTRYKTDKEKVYDGLKYIRKTHRGQVK